MEESREEILEKLGIVKSLRGSGIFGEARWSTSPVDNSRRGHRLAKYTIARYDQIGIDIGEMISLDDMPNLEYQRENILPHITYHLYYKS